MVSSQIDLHARYGGVVPEIASRAHVELIGPVLAEALEEAGLALGALDAVAACRGPGLAGALLVGVSAAKALALVAGIPYVGVNHLEAHLYAAWLEQPDLEPPLAVLVVSGGHTLLVIMEAHGRYRVVGQTVDDAAGEAFDKVARFLGLGYPGGPAIDALARSGDPAAIPFPRAMPDQADFSYAGLKTAVVNHVRQHPDDPVADVAASFQAAAVDQLVAKLAAAADEAGAPTLVLGGGVAANSALRAQVGALRRGDRTPRLPPRAAPVHRQRRDDRRRGLVALAGRRPHTARRRRRPDARAARRRLRRACRAVRRDDILRTSTHTCRVLTVAEHAQEAHSMKLHPLEDRIVVRAGEPEETTVSGLVIPDTAKEKPQQGEVLAVGPGRRAENTGEIVPLDLKVGDTVVYSKYGGTEITVDGEDLLILTGRDVLAKVEK